MECVDWNSYGYAIHYTGERVALFMECVDWNNPISLCSLSTLVALFMECVDWNLNFHEMEKHSFVSHSSWSAWIEIFLSWLALSIPSVALFMECVDWNNIKPNNEFSMAMSHSSWSAWIEILRNKRWKGEFLRSHSSWSAWIEICWLWFGFRLTTSRTLHGVRGLKCVWIEFIIKIKNRRTLHGVRGLK